MQLIAKMCPTGKQDQAWPWIAPAAMEAHNAAIHNPMSQGSIGITPSEIMHGAKPLTKAGLEAAETVRSVTNADPGNRQFVEAVAQAHNKAHEYVQECKTAYEKRLVLRDDVRNALRHVKDFQAGDIVRHGMSDSDLKTMGRKKSKLHPVNSKRVVVVESLGFGRYELQEYDNTEADTVQSSADLMKAEKSPADADNKKAMLQAIRTREKTTEYEIEKVIGEQGVIAQGTKQ